MKDEYDFTLTGTTKLITSNSDVLMADDLEAWRKDTKNRQTSKPGDDRSPAWTWQTRCYFDAPDDPGNKDFVSHLTMPAENIMACLRKAGTQEIMKKQKTFKEASQSGLLLKSDFCTFLVNGKQIPKSLLDEMRDLPFAEQSSIAIDHGFRLFVKRVTIGQSKNVRVRPLFPKWEIKGRIQIKNDAITKSILEKLFAHAGQAGLGDWRPSSPKSPGTCGMFEAKIH